jgi:hypothetical protein
MRYSGRGSLESLRHEAAGPEEISGLNRYISGASDPVSDFTDFTA